MIARLRVFAAALLPGVLVFGTACHNAPDRDGMFTQDNLLIAPAAQLQATVVTATQDLPMRPGTNVLWCGSLQLAWNEGCALLKEDLRLRDPSALVDALNQHAFTSADLDPASYVALAGFVHDGIHKRIRSALEEKFPGLAGPRSIPSEPLTPRPQDFVLYAYLFKNLEFSTPFERLTDRPLVFDGKQLPSFGMGPYKPGHDDLYPQVSILDYQSAKDFVIELKTRSQGDRLILAKTAPQETLAATVQAVQLRAVAAHAEPASHGDVLRIPKLNFDITRTYEELEHKQLVVRNPAVVQDARIVSAVQNTRFQMDGKGVVLRSEAHVAWVDIGKMSNPPAPHVMVFDQPFLILLERTGAQAPYFALWVANPELLVPR
jgi:hypothetical protein